MKNTRRKALLWIVSALLLKVGMAPQSAAQGVYSYVDKQGIRTFTNTPRKAVRLDKRFNPPDQTSRNPAPRSGALSRFDPIIRKYANEYQLDPLLIKAMIYQESRFKPKAVSPKGARGLMQLMPATAARLGVSDAFNPEQNIRGGMKHMRFLLDMFNNDLILSLAAYNAGENLVRRIQKVPNIPETVNYVKSITSRYGTSHTPPSGKGRQPNRTTLYRYVDHNGVLHLTNIPPVRRPGPSWIAAEPSNH